MASPLRRSGRWDVVAYALAVIAVAVAWLGLDTLRFVAVSIGVGVLCALLHGQRRVEDARSELRRLVLTGMGGRILANGAGPIVRTAVAARLVGWKQVESAGRPIDAVFRVVGEDERVPLR